MTIVERVVDKSALDPDCKLYRPDTITLPWEDRRRGHGRRQSDSGVGFAISLPNGTVLKAGDCMVLDAEKTVIEVREAAESVYIIRPKTPQEWAFYAFHVGNRHQSVMIGETELIFLQNPAVQSLLEQLGVEYAAGERSFTAALAGHPH